MFKYENGKIKWMGAAIELQNGLYFNGEPELEYESGISLTNENRDFFVDIHGDTQEDSPMEDLEDFFSGGDYETAVAEIHRGGLDGIVAEWESRRETCYEEIYELGRTEDDEYILLHIFLHSYSKIGEGTDIKEVLEREDIKRLLESVRCED